MAIDLFCPDCKPRRTHLGKQFNARLEVVERNYSGTGIDITHCTDCGHCFEVTYKVDTIRRDMGWEDKDEIERLAKEREERTATAILKQLLKNPNDAVALAKTLSLAKELLGEDDAQEETR